MAPRPSAWIGMSPSRFLLLAALAATAASQWPQLCPGQSGGPWGAYNESRCPVDATCCKSGFSDSSVGCCTFPNATCCPNGYGCCPSGTVCNLISTASDYNALYNCTAPSRANVTNRAVCKSGPAHPPSSTLHNVLWIGDSLSLGMIPFLAANLSDIALVQHAPWGQDGGAEETAYGLYCLEHFLHSPSGMDLKPDLIMFNFGMHDGPMGNNTAPGQNAPPDGYSVQLALITGRLQEYAARMGAGVVFLHTTPFICTTQQDGCEWGWEREHVKQCGLGLGRVRNWL